MIFIRLFYESDQIDTVIEIFDYIQNKFGDIGEVRIKKICRYWKINDHIELNIELIEKKEVDRENLSRSFGGDVSKSGSCDILNQTDSSPFFNICVKWISIDYFD